MIYSVIFLGLILLRYALAEQQKLRAQLYPAVLLVLFLFAGFRFEVGCDWNGYHRHFISQLDLDFRDALAHREPLWWVLVQMIGRMGFGYPWLNVASCAIFFAGCLCPVSGKPQRSGWFALRSSRFRSAKR